MRSHSRLRFSCLLIVGLVCTAPLAAETPSPQIGQSLDAANTYDYFAIDAGKLVAEFGHANIVSDPVIMKADFYQMKTDPRVVVPTGCEAYILNPETPQSDYKGHRIIGRKPRGQAIKGSVYLIRRHPGQPRESVLAKLDFDVAKAPENSVTTTQFHLAKGRHFQKLWASEYAGSAVFRHLAMKSMDKAGKEAKPVGPNWPLRRDTGLNSTIGMMSGGRAISENLALRNELDEPKNYLGELIDLASVRGVTVREIDWKPRLADKPTELDPLAKFVPHNQYAVYMSSFETLTQMISRGSELAMPLVHWFEPQSRKTDVLGFYQKQLALPLNGLTQNVGQALISEVAITGSDPYFRTGTDIAVLMKSDQAKTLHQGITALIGAQTAAQKDVQHTKHKIEGMTFAEWSNQTRSVSSFVAVQDDTVVVSNSMHQIMQVLKCRKKEVKSMHALDEYKFFRQRYARGGNDNAALIVITDAAIRRWCSPTWRISASRRTRARATLADATVQHADALLSGSIETDTVFHSENPMPNAGTMTLTRSGVYSRQYGTLDFQTPISEMKLWRATQKEIDLYTRWRSGYERQWRRVFDPIAVQIDVSDRELTADLTVIPLVLNSQYARYIQVIGKSRLKSGFDDHHQGSLASIDMAIDTEGWIFQIARSFLQNQMAGLDVDPFAWIDGSASFYFDYDKEWMERFDARDPWDFSAEELLEDIPVALHVPSKDNLRLAMFMSGLRSFLTQTAPNMITWGTKKHKEFTYVTMQPSDNESIEMFYVTLPDGITVSGNENLIQRVIDRHVKEKKAAGKQRTQKADAENEDAASEQSTPDPAKMRAPQMALQVTGAGARAMLDTNFQGGMKRTHRIAWSNLPILNYFRHRYPERDPLKVYETLFGQTLQEPTGGNYTWDAKRSTYVSSHHGYHLEPKAGPQFPPELGMKDNIATTVSFQDGGLRATLSVTEK